MKHLMALVLALVLALSSVGVLAEGETQELRAGTSDVYFFAPVGYEKGAMNEEDTNLGQVAYYKSANELMDFDIYYWAKATDETVEMAFAEETDEEIAVAEFNGITFLYYYDVEQFAGEDESFKTVTYIMDDGDYFVEFVFWLDGENAEEKVKAIMETVTMKIDTEARTDEGLIRLGTSDLYIAPEKAYVKGDIHRAETDECMVAYYKSEETLLDFDVYYWAKATDETLESTAAKECEEFSAEAADREINGIATKYYYAEEEYEGEFYKTLTYIIDDGEYLAELVFWLDGEGAEAEAEQIIGTLMH